ncbi:BolA family protein [Leptothrix cholodnii SP-6]|uniref:BolA family protein n=1 Tax=Leptothrix cholodnii (strain ATCC 51168 / LMG 8142 / SP-6) TaxID=395495 RepID=B1XZX9_LEPCP|nr:BolA family protein [Leptothrix cholodnii]ACB34106.1 BolA family protein [Leptothrix cholodnii SP-6]
MSARNPDWVDAAEIEATLRAAFDPQELRVDDESHQHAGHAGASSGSHFRVTIRAVCFSGKSRVARHRLVYDSLAFLMPRGIHALAIVAEAAQDATTDSTPG